MADNVISLLTKKFSVRVFNLHEYLIKEKKEYIIAQQVYRSGTSIAANVAESVFAQSQADYINKLTIALKEANETKQWIETLYSSKLLTDKEFESIYNDIKIIIGTLVNILKKVNPIIPK